MRSLVTCAMAIVFTITGAALLGHDAYMSSKAEVAHQLIDSAWQHHREDGKVHHPWNWADFFPIGLIEVPGTDITCPVLSDASGQSMAFGLGHVPGTARPGEEGNVVLAGHRDSHAEFMSQISQGDTIILHDSNAEVAYQIIGSKVVNADNTAVLSQEGPDRLTLVTCFPFGGLTPTDERYVLTGFRVTNSFDEPEQTIALMMDF